MEVCVARQPIFDKRLKVYAYELLFRPGQENEFVEIDADHATSSVITNSFLVIGLNILTGGKKAFINFTQNLLMDETAINLPKDYIVVEILENVVPDKGIITACRKLKDMGYVLALDDFVFEPRFEPLIKLADIIKVDFIATEAGERQSLVKKFGYQNIKFLAEKVETQQEFDQALNMGYSYFQGFFFSKPIIISSHDIPGYKLNYLSILHEIHRPEIDFNQIENIIKRDVSISYKLLRFINSAFFSFNTKIHSIKQALVLLGINEFKKWVSLIVLKGLGEDKPLELMMVSIIRARLCELIGENLELKDRSADLFFMGMFSLIDTFMNRPMAEVLEQLPLAEETKDALLGNEGRYRDVFELVVAYEKIEWANVSEYAKKLGIDQLKVADYYIESLNWANQLLTI